MRFLFPSQIGRLSYLFRTLIIAIATAPLGANFDKKDFPASTNDVLILLLSLAIIAYWLGYIVRPRCKDIGMAWGWMFLMLVPLANLGLSLLLLFKRRNQFARRPLPTVYPGIATPAGD